jgi:hypothetical protein
MGKVGRVIGIVAEPGSTTVALGGGDASLFLAFGFSSANGTPDDGNGRGGHAKGSGKWMSPVGGDTGA